MQKDLKKIDAETKNKSMRNIQESIDRKRCLAEICLPRKAGGPGKIIDLNMNLDEMRKFLQNI